MKIAICFTNFGPYHLARLRALGLSLQRTKNTLLAYEVAGCEERYPWQPSRGDQPFDWKTFFPDAILEKLTTASCIQKMQAQLDQDRPDAVAVVGYTRPESLAMLRWAERHSIPRILLSESQAIDKPRVWWKEAIKSRRVRRFSAALVGGPRHLQYLQQLGFPSERISLGYNAVDHDTIRDRVAQHRTGQGQPPINGRPYFLAVNRFVPEKNLEVLIQAYAKYRQEAGTTQAWDLIVCGDGPTRTRLQAQVKQLDLCEHVHFPGFLQETELIPYWGSASAFIHPSLMEPWGLVVNEAAAASLPLLVSDRAGCVETLVPNPSGTTGKRFDPSSQSQILDGLNWMTARSPGERKTMGETAEQIGAAWGPMRFASGTLEALEIGLMHQARLDRTQTPTLAAKRGN